MAGLEQACGASIRRSRGFCSDLCAAGPEAAATQRSQSGASADHRGEAAEYTATATMRIRARSGTLRECDGYGAFTSQVHPGGRPGSGFA